MICVEEGRLETEAILLVESLRAWGGACADAPVYAFAPRADMQPSPETIERLESMATTVITEPMVGRFAETPTYNKVTVSAWAERELDHDTLVFTDTDSVFLGEPAELAERRVGRGHASGRPPHRRLARQGQERAVLAEDVRGARREVRAVRRDRRRSEPDPRLLEQRARRRAALSRSVRGLGTGADPPPRRRSRLQEMAPFHGPAQLGGGHRRPPRSRSRAPRPVQLSAAPSRDRCSPGQTSSTSTSWFTSTTASGFTCRTRCRRSTPRSTPTASASGGSPSGCRFYRSSRTTTSALSPPRSGRRGSGPWG